VLGSFKLNFILLYTICGFAVAYGGVYLLKRQYLGRIWGAILIAVIGSFLGALLSSTFLGTSMAVWNILAALTGSIVSLMMFGKASRLHHYI
jgi:ABC-type Co2+ transport system permease subunit